MKLEQIKTITATLKLMSGLHIGAGDVEMHIGGIDNQVIKNPVTQKPYIPGSSLKGKIRSLLEWRSGSVDTGPIGIKQINNPKALPILRLFGVGAGDKLNDDEAKKIGPTRLSFWDCYLTDEWDEKLSDMPLEAKSENTINRISGEATNPRQTERVPSGVEFDFKLTIKQISGDTEELLNTVLAGMKLLELDSLGGSGSRGYGKVKFENVKIDDEDISGKFKEIQPFTD